LVEGFHNNFILGLFFTVILGAYFTFLQAGEYYEASFNMRDAIYGSIFYMGTGFHGFHVLIGTSFLLITSLRGLKLNFINSHHVGLEAAA
jgi:heme/copper-type cytochrome/quinol oxidase subunit 3